MQDTEVQAEHLGNVLIPSNIVMLVDMGLLNLWTHDRAPLLPEGAASEQTVEDANAGADFAIEGPDAEVAGNEFDRQWHPLFWYDIPGHALEEAQTKFEQFAMERNLRAHLCKLSQRVSHRTRVDNALRYGDGVGIVNFHGISAIVLEGVPTDRTLEVVGYRLKEDDYDGHWDQVHLVIDAECETESSHFLGHVAVDKARLMFIDVDALKKWQHEEPIDGLADFVFWGRDAAKAAEVFNVESLGSNDFGWVNLPVEEVVNLGIKIEDYRDSHKLKFATDFRPHSHHFQVMEQVRSSSTESGTIRVGDSLTCGFMTTWGDGFFEVFLDLTAAHTPARLRIEFAPTD